MAKHYKSIENLQNSTLEELVTVDEIGVKIAQSLIEFFENQNNLDILNRLRNYGILLELQETTSVVSSDLLKGKNFVVSGVFENISRDELKQLIENNGGKIGSSISSKTHYVVAGKNMGPAKLEKATQLGITILSEEEFNAMLC